MNRSIWELLKIPNPAEQMQTPLQTTAHAPDHGAAYLFANCSQAIVLTTGVLVIVSLKELGPTGALHSSRLTVQVTALANLASEVAETAGRALKLTLSALPSAAKTALPTSDVDSLEEIQRIGEVYSTLLKAVALETKHAAGLQELKVHDNRDGNTGPGAFTPDAAEIEAAIQTLSRHALALELRLEDFETRFRNTTCSLR